jgi:hypothetical protein
MKERDCNLEITCNCISFKIHMYANCMPVHMHPCAHTHTNGVVLSAIPLPTSVPGNWELTLSYCNVTDDYTVESDRLQEIIFIVLLILPEATRCPHYFPLASRIFDYSRNTCWSCSNVVWGGCIAHTIGHESYIICWREGLADTSKFP